LIDRDRLELLLSLLFALSVRHDGLGAFGCAMEVDGANKLSALDPRP
jgi:hypothetical protein